MKDKKYLLFDLDGTLTDPFTGITRSVQHALKHYGIIENDLNLLTPFIVGVKTRFIRAFQNF